MLLVSLKTAKAVIYCEIGTHAGFRSLRSVQLNCKNYNKWIDRGVNGGNLVNSLI